MDSKINLLDVKVDMTNVPDSLIKVTDKISIGMKYPEFSILDRATKFENPTDMAFDMIVESIEFVFDGEQYYYAKETSPGELIEFVESLNQDQFAKIEEFFNNLPKLNKKLELTCKKCKFQHTIEVEGLDSFFG